MTFHRLAIAPSRPSLRARVVAAPLLALAVAACGATAPSASPATAPSSPSGPSSEPTAGAPTSAASVPAGPSLTPVPGTDESSPPATVGQTDTEWGRIWDTIPASFPRYPGSIPTDPGGGPASATLAVPTDPKTAATELQSALEASGYSTEAQSGPFEDGSIIIDSIGEDPACRVETRLAPQGSTTLMTVFYGTACPAP